LSYKKNQKVYKIHAESNIQKSTQAFGECLLIGVMELKAFAASQFACGTETRQSYQLCIWQTAWRPQVMARSSCWQV